MRLNAFIARWPRPAPLPPLWLAASALTAAITVAFGIARWIDHYVTNPNAEDFRLQVGAARIGLMHGWSHIYDVDLQTAASAGLGPIDSMHLFIGPPSTAWMAAPLAWLPLPTGYLIWTLVNLAALGAAWRLVVSSLSLAGITILLASLAIWPMHYQFWLGHTVVATLTLLAASWFFLDRDQPSAAGIFLALAFLFKPQDALLVPVALLVAGRWRLVAAFALTGAVIVALWMVSLGTAGIVSWLHAIAIVKADPHTAPMTYAFIFGRGWLATIVEVALGVAAMFLAWYRRDRIDLVFALGLIGTTASAIYLHEMDIAILVLATWIVLRSGPSWTQNVWMLAGIAAAQFIAIGQAIPMLLWEPVWITLLGLEPVLKRLEGRRAVPASSG